MTQLTFTKIEKGKFESTFTSGGGNTLQLGATGSYLMLHVYARVDESLEWTRVDSRPISGNFISWIDIPEGVFVRLEVDADSVEFAYLK